MNRIVLVVDDNRVERTILSGFLKKEYTVIEAENGKEALEIIREKGTGISAVLLDLVMSEMNGFSVLAEMRKNKVYQSIPVIVSTGLDTEEVREKAISFGANGFLTKPYSKTLLLHLIENTVRLRETALIADAYTRDRLTGLFNRESFFTEADKMIHHHEPGYYLLACFDVDNFKLINDQYGTEKGDAVLCYIADCIAGIVAKMDGLACRFSADKFAILYPASYRDSSAIAENHIKTMNPPCINRTVKIRIGRYVINDLTLSISGAFDRATLAQESIKGRYDVYIADYHESMHRTLVQEQRIVNAMVDALKNGEFEPWYQPQYNHATGALIGAEALVRWRREDGFIPPSEFIPAFESNGFIYQMDQYIWDTVCRNMRRWLDEGKKPLPVSVNVSRRDLFHRHFVQVFTDIIHKYNLDYDLIRLEVTESAFAESTGQIVAKVDQLIAMGFTVEIDDFGSGYSSLNTLKDVPASILKLDMKFLENGKDSSRGGNIVESVVRMAKWLGMAVIAEGVETLAQADYLRSIGCYYIQGYFYARPMPADEYEKLFTGAKAEFSLTRLQTVKNLDNNRFWNPESMETLIFNSYVGGACIFEYHHGKTELLRTNEQYRTALGSLMQKDTVLNDLSIISLLDEAERKKIHAVIEETIDTKKETTCVVRLSDSVNTEFVRITLREIAQTGHRHLFYCVMVNITKQQATESKERDLSIQLSTIMSNVQGGIAATLFRSKNDVRIIFTNDGFYQMYGYTKEQIEAEVPNVIDLILPEDREKTMETVARIVRERGSDTYEYRCRRRDGSTVWIHCTNSVISLDGVGDTVLLAVTTDITELRLAQLREGEAADKLRTVLSHIGNGVTAIALHGEKPEFLFSNDKYYEIVGYTPEEYAAVTEMDMFAPVYFEDRERLRKTVTEFNHERGSKEVNYRLTRLDGKIVWVHAVLTITDIAGIDVPVQIGAFSDVTAEKEANDQLLFLNETVHSVLETPDIEKAVAGILHKILDYFGADRSYVVEFDREKSGFSNIYEVCADGVAPMASCLQILTYSTSAGWYRMLKQNQPFVVENTENSNEDEAKIGHLLASKEDCSLIFVPLWRDGALIGFCGASNPTVSRQQIGHLTAISDCIAVLLTRRDLERNILCKNGNDLQLSEKIRRQMLPEVFSAIMKSSTDITFVKDKDFRYLCCSPMFAKILGLKDRSFVVGKTDYELFSPEIAACFRADDEQLFSDGKPIIDKSETFLSEDGMPHYSRLSKYLLRDTGGHVLGIYGIGRDITNRLADSNRLKLLTDTIPGGIATFVYSPKGNRREYYNDGFCALFGYEREEFDRLVPSLESIIFPEDIGEIKKQTAILLADGTSPDCVYRVHTRDGSYKWINQKAIVVDRVGETAIVNAVFLDVTEQQKEKEKLRVSEELNRLAIEHSGNIITRFDVGNRTLTLPDFFNPIFDVPHILHGLPDEQIRLGRISPDTADRYAELFQNIVNGVATGMTTYKQMSTKGWRWLEARFTTVFSDSGKPVSAVISFADITEQLEKEVVYNKWQQSLDERTDDSYTLLRCNLSAGRAYDSYEGNLLQIEHDNEIESFNDAAKAYVKHFVKKEDRARYLALMNCESLLAAYYRGTRSKVVEFREITDDGVRWLRLTVDLVEYPSSKDIEAYLMYENIDEQKKAELMMLERSKTDPLTGILNRSAFIVQAEIILDALAEGEQHALLMIDVDNFKHINDHFGHGTGDLALQSFTSSIRAVLRKDDLFGRLGGDEFFVLLKNVPDKESVAAKTRQICALKNLIPGTKTVITASIGIVMIPGCGKNFEDLYKKVDQALYLQKQNGKNGYHFA